MNSPIATYKNLHVDPANLILAWIQWNNDQIPQKVDKFPDPLPTPGLWWKPSREYFVREWVEVPIGEESNPQW